jgi:hypothetical protein
MQAIETHYNGYRFRSRLEARWAVFMDTLGVRYEYEPEGFHFEEGVNYLPDFWIPSLSLWIEIKPTIPDDSERRKVQLLSMAQEYPVYLFYQTFDYLPPEAWVWYPGGGWDEHQQWCQCPHCLSIGIHFQGSTERACKNNCVPNANGRGYSIITPRLEHAYWKARTVTFEWVNKS